MLHRHACVIYETMFSSRDPFSVPLVGSVCISLHRWGMVEAFSFYLCSRISSHDTVRSKCVKMHLFGIFYYRTKIKTNQYLIANKNWEHTAQVCSTIQYDVNMFVFIKARKSDLCRKELKSFFFFIIKVVSDFRTP